MTKFEARICKGMPTDCCDYGVISFETGKEVCRVWLEDDARKIADLLNAAAPASAAEPVAWRKENFPQAVEPFFIDAAEKTEPWMYSVFTVPLFAHPPFTIDTEGGQHV